MLKRGFRQMNVQSFLCSLKGKIDLVEHSIFKQKKNVRMILFPF